MSEPLTKQMRAVWPLHKARVVERTENYIKIAIGGSTTITISHDMHLYDVREGDLLTLYTEVPIAKPEGTA